MTNTSQCIWHSHGAQLFHEINEWIDRQPTDEQYAAAKLGRDLALASALFPAEVNEAYRTKKVAKRAEQKRLEQEQVARELARIAEKEREERQRTEWVVRLKQERKERLAAELLAVQKALEAQQAEAQRIIAEEKAAMQAEFSADSEKEILEQRDFLMQRLGVDKLPDPSSAQEHKQRGRLRKMLTGKR